MLTVTENEHTGSALSDKRYPWTITTWYKKKNRFLQRYYVFATKTAKHKEQYYFVNEDLNGTVSKQKHNFGSRQLRMDTWGI